jgi:hypothetical protein
LRGREAITPVRTREGTSLPLAAILLSLVCPAAEHIAAPSSKDLAFVLAASGSLVFMVSVAVARQRVPDSAEAGWLRRILADLAAAVVVLAVCALSSVGLFAVGWRLHDLTALAPGGLAAWVASGSLISPFLTLWTGSQSQSVRLTLEGLGLHQVWFLLVALTTLAWLASGEPDRRAQLRRVLAALAVIAGYAIARFGFLVLLGVELDRPELLWRQPWPTLSWLPLAFVLRVPRPPYSLGWRPRGAARAGTKRRLAVTFVALVAGMGLAGAAGFDDPGQMKRGRVLIDESHCNWEWTREPFDTAAFGIRAEYNYYCLAQYLGHYYEVKVSEDSLSAAVLDSTDVLVIKTPTAPFTTDEIEAVTGFVKSGGGLLLIGDHTNLFGMSAYLNAIAARFGMRFRFDDTFDLQTTGLSTFRRPRCWFHPAIRDLKIFGFLTSCSIEGGWGVQPVIVGSGLGSEDADYGHPNFFGDIAYDLRDRFGLFLQAGARRWGRGRVLLFTDSTCFSNFCMFGPGKPEVALGFVDYLNRNGARYPQARLAGLALATALAGFALRLRAVGVRPASCASGAGRVRRGCGCWVGLRHLGLIMLAGFALGTGATARFNARIYGPIRERFALRTLLFDTEHSGGSFFTYLGEAPQNRWCEFAELYISAERAGLCPRAGTITDVGPSTQAAVIVNPTGRFGDDDLGRLAAYVTGGGRLLILDTVANSASTANQVLARFGMRAMIEAIATRPARSVLPVDGGRRRVRAPAPGSMTALPGARDGDGSEDILPTLVVVGADPEPSTAGTAPAKFTKSWGKGKVVVCTNSFRYSAAVVGTPLERKAPPKEVLKIYREIFALLRGGS